MVTFVQTCCCLLQFQGSCFVIFGSDETAKKFLETPDVKYGDVTLLREYRCIYALPISLCTFVDYIHTYIRVICIAHIMSDH